jgi:hypothetical protein
MKTIINQYGTPVEVPDAANTKSAETNFKERKTLTELVDNRDLFDQTVDLRVQKHLYGRVDLHNNSIYPDASKVSFNTKAYVFGFDFVNKLINDFNTDWKSLAPDNLYAKSIYQEIQVENKDYRDIDETFRDYYLSLFEAHHENLFVSGEEVKIDGFDSFVGSFTRFLTEANAPFTRECLIKSSKYKSENTLLIYNLQKHTHGNDEQTFQTFYLDNGIYLMTSALLQYGLVLDRDSPWRFVVNLKSPQVVGSTLLENSGLSSVFRDYYIQASTTEVANTVDLLVTAYNNFVESATLKVTAQVLDPQFNYVKPVQCAIDRNTVTASPEVKLSILNFLINMRLSETQHRISPQQKQVILNLLQQQGLQAAYEKLHVLVNSKIKLRFKANMNRPEALYVANHVGCRGATLLKGVGWVPCKTEEDWTQLINMPSGFYKDAQTRESIQLLNDLILDKMET